MKKVLVGLFLVAATVALSAQEKRAVGTWKLDSAQSSNPGWKSATLVVSRDDDSGIAWRISGTGQDGKPVHESYSSAWDKEAPIKGSQAGETGTWHKDGTFDLKQKDGSSTKMTTSVSDDGKSMTVTGTMNGQDTKDVWVKAGKSSAGKAATKKSKKAAAGQTT